MSGAAPGGSTGSLRVAVEGGGKVPKWNKAPRWGSASVLIELLPAVPSPGSVKTALFDEFGQRQAALRAPAAAAAQRRGALRARGR